MALRRWRGVICQEGVQTGDGRVIAEGALTWADLPLPLAWMRDGDQHVMPTCAPTIGTVESIERVGNDIIGEGTIDDEQPDGAEMVRMLEAGTASGGGRQFVSIDADDYEVEIVATEALPTDEDVLLIASASGPWRRIREIFAAAGDPDPGPGGGPDGEMLMMDSADAILERATRLRIRGVTCCAVSAFSGAFIELVDAAEPAVAQEPEAVAASGPTVITNDIKQAEKHPLYEIPSILAHAPAAPPDGFFQDPELQELQRWVTVTEDGRVMGHLAGFGECHIGMAGRCITPEALTAGGFDYFRHGHVVTSSGQQIATGPIALRGGHASPDRSVSWRQAQAHYDDPACAVMDVAVGTDAYGVWFSGAIRPGATPEDIYAVRASGVSGDWRLIGGQLRLVGICSVNVPGFPKVRVAVASGQIVALVAAGGRPMSAWEHRPCTDCADTAEQMERRLARLEELAAPTILASLDSRIGHIPLDDRLSALESRVR